jgi:hypothetical protein
MTPAPRAGPGSGASAFRRFEALAIDTVHPFADSGLSWPASTWRTCARVDADGGHRLRSAAHTPSPARSVGMEAEMVH